MTRGDIMRGLSMAMTLQNVTGSGGGGTSGAAFIQMVTDTDRYQPMKNNPASMTDYLTVDFSGDYEICVTAKCFGATIHTQCLLGQRNPTRRSGPFMDISYNAETYPNSYYFRHSDDEDIFADKTVYPLVLNQWMVHKLSYRSGTLAASVSYPDGTAYFSDTLTGVSPGPPSRVPLIGGELSSASKNDFIAENCIIDFSNTYIATNGNLVWGRKAID